MARSFRARRALGRVAYQLARSEFGAWLASVVVSRAPLLLPARRLATTPAAVAFRHPRPEVRDHIVVVPRRRIRDLGALPTEGEAAIALMIGAAEAALPGLPALDRVFTINVGVRLDVQQLHGHLLPAAAARRLLSEASSGIEVPRDDPEAFARAIRSVLEQLDGGAAHVDGSLVVTGLGSPSWCLAPSIARGEGNG